jgi:hypothetical protein
MRRYAVYETEPVLSALEEAGYASVAQVLSAQQCSEARARIDELRPMHWDEVHAHPERFAVGRYMDRYLCVFNRDPYWLQFLDRPGIIDLAEAALGPDCHIIGVTAWRSHPGFRSEPLHVDYLPVTWAERTLPDTVRVPMFILTAHFYCTDVTGDLAPTVVVPGSHRAARAPRPGESHWNGRAPETVLAGAGDALVFRSDVWHRGSGNSSPDAVRYLLQVHYGRREMAQHFSPFVGWQFNPAVLGAASKRQRRLLGDHAPGAYD